MKYKILCIGNQWRGSDDGSLFRAFSRAGHYIDIVDDKLFVPSESTSFPSKVFRRLGNPFYLADYNKAVKLQLNVFTPHVVCVYKGTSLEPDTLEYIRRSSVPVFCIYPDVSHFDHGRRIPNCIPKYDFIFHTKSFGIEELKDKFGYTKTTLIQHCADPDTHRRILVDRAMMNELNADASFIGSYSDKKNALLAELLRLRSTYKIKIWGNGWERSPDAQVRKAWQKQSISGDLYAAAINCSLINIAILSEAGQTSRSGDQVTSRTFHIPGSGGFMLHERTKEFLDLFDEGKEAACFNGAEELADKVTHYIQNEPARLQIAERAHEKVMRLHTSDHRVNQILSVLKSKNIL